MMETGQYLLLNLFRSRITNKSLESILSDLYFAKRLPISVPVLELLIHEGLKQDLERMGCTIESIGNIEFVTRIPPSCLIFEPSNVWNSDKEIRDAVVSIHKAAASKKSQIPLVPCEALTRDACTDLSCPKVHYSFVLNDKVTDVTAGLCSYLDLCKNEACKFIHVRPELEPLVVENDHFSHLSQWIQCDIRYFPISSIFSNGIVSAFLIDPPWDIHMKLTYGTLTDDEMRDLDMSNVHSEDEGGFVFIWATTRTVEVARDCLRLWGYLRVDEIVWLKTNQIGGTVRSGRTGHWLNHNKEHCLVGMKGNVSWANVGHYRQDCDVIVSPVRENSRKPDELYSMIERIVGMNQESPSRLCVELFGRSHNRRPGWVTLGNQLQGSKIFHPVLAKRLSECGMHALVNTDS